MFEENLSNIVWYIKNFIIIFLRLSTTVYTNEINYLENQGWLLKVKKHQTCDHYGFVIDVKIYLKMIFE